MWKKEDQSAAVIIIVINIYKFLSFLLKAASLWRKTCLLTLVIRGFGLALPCAAIMGGELYRGAVIAVNVSPARL